jgi:hypothetical protein
MRRLFPLILVVSAACGSGEGSIPYLNNGPDAAPAQDELTATQDDSNMCALGWTFLDAENEGSSILVEADCGQTLKVRFKPVPPIDEKGFCDSLRAWTDTPNTEDPDTTCGQEVFHNEPQGSVTVYDDPSGSGLRIAGACACLDDDGPDISIQFDLALD